FFEEEDGIRDRNVTGVQTCALPIYNLVSNLIKLKGKSYDTVFEIGSGTGFLTENIKEKIKFNKIILNDLSDNFTNIIPNEYLKEIGRASCRERVYIRVAECIDQGKR